MGLDVEFVEPVHISYLSFKSKNFEGRKFRSKFWNLFNKYFLSSSNILLSKYKDKVGHGCNVNKDSIWT